MNIIGLGRHSQIELATVRFNISSSCLMLFFIESILDTLWNKILLVLRVKNN